MSEITGFAITVDDQYFLTFRQNKEKYPEAEYADFRITVNGIQKVFTYGEFKERLGF